MVTCGRCHNKHASAQEVRECYAGAQTRVINATTEEVVTGLPAYATDPATDKQIKFIKDLTATKDADQLPADVKTTWSDIMEGKPASKHEASRLITAFGPLPVTKVKEDHWQMIPEGKYALPGADGHVIFYQVDKPQSGKWAGQTWVAQLTGAPGDWRRTNLGRRKSDEVLADIAADPVAAARLFGDKWCICGRCSSPLSNVRSRAAGFGEVCATKSGWPYPNRAEAMRMLRERGVELPSDEQLLLLEDARLKDEQAALDSGMPEWSMS